LRGGAAVERIAETVDCCWHCGKAGSNTGLAEHSAAAHYNYYEKVGAGTDVASDGDGTVAVVAVTVVDIDAVGGGG
jgi:hypothetical protein